MAKKQDSKNPEVIILRSVFPKNKITYSLQPCKMANGLFPDCVRKVDSKGDMILSESDKESGNVFIPETEIIVVTDGTTFDTSNPLDNARWEAIKHNKIIAKSRDERDKSGTLIIDGENTYNTTSYDKAFKARYGFAELYIDRPGREAEIKVSKKQRISEAWNYIFNDSHEGLITKAKVLGRNGKDMLLPDLKDFLVELAERNPSKIIQLYTGDDISLRILLIDAIEKKTIVVKNGLYIYADNIILGASDEAAIMWFKEQKNQKTVDLIKRDTYPELYT